MRRKGIGSKLLKKLQQRIKEIEQKHPTQDKAMFGANTSSTERDSLHLLTNDEYKIVWSSLEMEYENLDDLHEEQLPNGFVIKKPTEDHYRLVYDTDKRVYQGTWGETPSSEEEFQEFLEENSDKDLWTVAWMGDQIAGFVISIIEKGRGEITQVSVLPEFRRRGLAKALMVKNMQVLKNKGVERVRLHTDAEGKAEGRQLYERIGFKALKENFRMRKPLNNNNPENKN